MKKIISGVLAFMLCFCFSACKESQKNNDRPGETSVEVKNKLWNFGEITEGEIITHVYYLKNTGDHNLLIRNIESGCGCTTVEYDKVPIPPGKEGKIEIAFNSEGRYGKQYKEISIFANIPEKRIILNFTGNVRK